MTTKVVLKKENGEEVELIFGIHSYKRFCELTKDSQKGYEQENAMDLLRMNYDFVTNVLISGVENARIYNHDNTKLSVEEAEIIIDELGGTDSEEVVKMLESFKFFNNTGEKKAETIPQKKTSRGKK